MKKIYEDDELILVDTQNEINTLLAKIDGITVPTKISDLADDSDFKANEKRYVDRNNSRNWRY